MRPQQISQASDAEQSPGQRQVLRLGGALAVLGGLGYAVTLLVHGDMPDQTTEIALAHIAGRPEWPALKLSLIVSVMLWVGAFVALASSLSQGASWLLSRMSAACLLIGAAVVLVEYSILGYEIKKIADAWQGASGRLQEHYLLMAEVLLGMTGGLFVSFIAWLLGAPYILMGLAIALGDTYPRWMGWVAVVLGAGPLVAGTTYFLGIGFMPFALLYGGFVIPLNIWLAVVGVFMWRRGRLAAEDGAAQAAAQAACAARS